MKKTIIYLEKELAQADALNTTMINAAANSPSGNSIDLPLKAEEHLRACEPRIATEIWQKHRIKVLKEVLEKILKN